VQKQKIHSELSEKQSCTSNELSNVRRGNHNATIETHTNVASTYRNDKKEKKPKT